jgi:uncharacterized membrane protein YgcG
MGRLWAVVAALFLFALPSPAQADERILRFVSDVRINKDASLDVTETIDVVSEGNQIRRGIYRDFPTRYRNTRGGRVRVGFTFIGAERDGMPETAVTEPVLNGVRIRIGKEDVFLEPGEHRYVIRYRTIRQIGRFEGYDELYWNATGNGWVFPIDVAEARISLPDPARFGQRAAYTGPQGSTERNAEVIKETPGAIAFRTTQALGPYEGLTVAAAFPKGVVAEPDDRTRAGWWLADYGPPLIGLAALAGLAGFYFIAWKRAGRNPRPGTVVPLFSPPDELTPAAMRYVWKMGADNRAFAAALVDLGVKGHVRMAEEDGGWFSGDKIRLERLASSQPLPAAEQTMLAQLAMSSESIVMEKKNHARFSAAKKMLDSAFKRQFEGRLFHRNWGWAIAGVLLFVAALWLCAAAVVASAGWQDPYLAATSAGCLITAGLLALLAQSTSGLGKWLLWFAVLGVGGIGLALGAPIIPAAVASGWWEPLVIPALALPLVISAFFWIAAPTREGRAVLDRIAGFKQYLSITERERLDRMHPPEDTPELFERYLPYAIALGVENRWAERFSGVLAAAAAQGQQGFGWYSGRGNPWDNPTGFARSVGSSLASTISSASTAPGSRSGSGGGGSSGGGGGGGGGGGCRSKPSRSARRMEGVFSTEMIAGIETPVKVASNQARAARPASAA